MLPRTVVHGGRKLVHGVSVTAVGLWLLLGLGFATSSQAATGPACGDTITASTTLHSDLRDCAGDGLVIGADGLTLDLNGHAIDGDAVSGGDDVGIRVDGHAGTVIRRGMVAEFDHAVRLTGASHNRILHLVATRNGDADIGRAILLDTGSDWNRIERNDASSNGRSGIAVLDSSHNVILRNRTTRNGVAGMGVFGGSGNRVLDNVLDDNGENGIAWSNGTSGGRIEGNHISGNPGIGIEADDTNDSLILRNHLIGNGDNLALFGNRNVVRANVVVGATGCPDGGCGFGVSIEGGSGNAVLGNIVLGARRDGIRVDTFAPDDLPTTGTVIRDNFVRGAGVDGISVGTETDNPVVDTRIESNRVYGAADDGIDVRRATTVLLGNRANDNGDLGISAATGVTDAAGNRASGNGNPAQCVGVACG